jgi:hypothetical protein
MNSANLESVENELEVGCSIHTGTTSSSSTFFVSPTLPYRPFAVHQRVRICSRPVACSLVIIKNLTTHNDTTRALWLCLYVPIF